MNTERVLPMLTMISSMWHHQNFMISCFQTQQFFFLVVWTFCSFFSVETISPIVGDKWVSGCGLRVWAHSGHAVIHKDPEWDVASSEDGGLHLDDVTQEIDTGRPWPLPVLCSDQAERWVEVVRWVVGSGRVVQIRLAQWFLIPAVQKSLWTHIFPHRMKSTALNLKKIK